MVKKLMTVLALAFLAGPAVAGWELDNDKSRIDFISVKNAAIAESHHFSRLVGYIGNDGNVTLTIDLDSVETLIPIRNERMREMLFRTADYPTATVSALVDPAILAAVADGGTISTEVPLKLSLHGVEASLDAPVVVVGEPGSLRVISARPVVISAADYGLGAGVEALRQVAGLANISTAVPVTINLLFTRAE